MSQGLVAFYFVHSIVFLFIDTTVYDTMCLFSTIIFIHSIRALLVSFLLHSSLRRLFPAKEVITTKRMSRTFITTRILVRCTNTSQRQRFSIANNIVERRLWRNNTQDILHIARQLCCAKGHYSATRQEVAEVCYFDSVNSYHRNDSAGTDSECMIPCNKVSGDDATLVPSFEHKALRLVCKIMSDQGREHVTMKAPAGVVQVKERNIAGSQQQAQPESEAMSPSLLSSYYESVY